MPGASARAIYRRLRAAELADWSRSLAWRLPLAGDAGLGAAILTGPVPSVARLTASLAVIGSVGWRLRFRASAEASAVEAILGAAVIPVVCVHGASVQWGCGRWVSCAATNEAPTAAGTTVC